MATIDELISTARDTTTASFRRRTATADLARSEDPRALETLTELLDDRDPYLRREVVASLARLREPRVMEVLRKALDDADDNIRRDAIEALGQIADGRVIPRLQVLAEDAPYSVRDAAQRALQQLQRRGIDPPVQPVEAILGSPPPAKPPPPATQPQPADMTIPAPAIAVREPPMPVPAPAAPVGRVQHTPPASECFLTTVPPAFDWQRAVRLRAFFENELPVLTTLYEQLARQQDQLLELERQQRQTFLQLGLHQADKEDDVARCEASLLAARENLARQEHSVDRARREQALLQTQADSAWNQWLGFFQPERGEKSQQLLSEIQAALRGLQDKVAAAREEVRQLEQQHDELSRPLQQLQSQLETWHAQRQAAAEAVGSTNEQIDARYRDHLLRMSSEQRQERLQRCGRLSTDAAFFGMCSEALVAALGDLSHWSRLLAEAEQQRQEATAAAEHQLESLAQTLAAGFRIETIDRHTPLRLQGTLRVSEQRGLFEGFSGADGSASGSGTGEAEYQLDQIAWNPPADLAADARAFTDAWALAGQQSARHRQLAAMLEARRRTVGEYVRFLRSELERDFSESSP